MIKTVSKKWIVSLTSFSIAFFFSTSNHALDLSLQLGGGFQNSDNIELNDEGELSDDLREAFIGFQLEEDSPLYFVDLNYVARIRDYKDDVVEDDNLFAGRAEFTLHAIANRLNWEFLHLRADLLTNAEDNDIPDNRETRNVYATGPDFILEPSTVDDLILRLRYTEIDFEQTENANNERISGALVWERELGPVSRLSALVGVEDVEYELSGAEQTFLRASAQYEADVRLGNYSIRLGYNEAESLDGRDVSGLLARVLFAYQINGNDFEVLYGRELTDTSIGLIENRTEDSIITDTFSLDDGTDSNFETIDILELQNLDITYRTANVCQRCVLTVSGFIDKFDFSDQPRDQKFSGINTSLRYNLTPRLDAVLQGGYSINEFLQELPEREDDTIFYGLGMDFQPRANMLLQANVRMQERESNIEEFNYEEMSFRLGFTWYFGTNQPL
ncbi:MAG: hypothetical protein AB8B48_05120 [Pseudomonadales bacterium]